MPITNQLKSKNLSSLHYITITLKFSQHVHPIIGRKQIQQSFIYTLLPESIYIYSFCISKLSISIAYTAIAVYKKQCCNQLCCLYRNCRISEFIKLQLRDIEFIEEIREVPLLSSVLRRLKVPKNAIEYVGVNNIVRFFLISCEISIVCIV